MTREAVLYFATPGDVRTALRPIAGRPLAYRALAGAVRAGCRRVGVPATLRGTAVERAIASTPSTRAAAYWLEPGAPVPDGPVVFVPAAGAIPTRAVATLVGSLTPAVLAESRESDAALVLVSPRGVARLWEDVTAGEPLADGLARVLKDEEPVIVDGGAWALRVVTDADARAVEARLRVGLGSAIDSGLDRAVHRRLARPLTDLAVRLGITPNQVSLASLGVGVIAAWCFWDTTVRWAFVGLALYLLSVVLDHADGEVARLTLAESRLGEWLDVLIDTVVHALIALGIGATVAQRAGPIGLLLGVLAAVGFVASSALAKTAPTVAADDQVGAFLSDMGARDGFYVMLLLFLAVLSLRPSLLTPLMIVVAVGAHGYWLSRAAHRLLTR